MNVNVEIDAELRKRLLGAIEDLKRIDEALGISRKSREYTGETALDAIANLQAENAKLRVELDQLKRNKA